MAAVRAQPTAPTRFHCDLCVGPQGIEEASGSFHHLNAAAGLLEEIEYESLAVHVHCTGAIRRRYETVMMISISMVGKIVMRAKTLFSSMLNKKVFRNKKEDR